MTIYTVYGIKPNYVSDFTYRGVSLKVHRPVKFDGEKCSEDWQFSKDGIGVAWIEAGNKQQAITRFRRQADEKFEDDFLFFLEVGEIVQSNRIKWDVLRDA